MSAGEHPVVADIIRYLGMILSINKSSLGDVMLPQAKH